ncbi:hypothetical protein BFW01_g6866 [Lasiodiplodia theobromae]|uniref:Uncharacterized protein n=1 Tax=Lasiodiplodia hormozganensis TaxID=869390 RepID=A0AA39YTX8_9PEZI|nr:uncharacterized protein LTHEOB_7709 [Lasiodiplodia theobromae]KAF4542517.1 hypothetical protein LTHEOB_7709 [Lasiodiplodia theobromae]KAF9635971.1 hypothetical protein BFW01_g6866 [Lasiodiplodia theobromae]KAK0658604.1 hypothetical protein DIS24_g4593 [Lasiodiplodia hormozganensis]
MADEAQETGRVPKQSKWKMFKREDSVSKQEKQKKTEADVMDFLKPSTTKNAPRIDVATAQRWPGASDLLAKAKTQHQSDSNLSSLPSSLRGGRPSRPRSKTLTVGFLNDPPHVIGEGGDESEIPPIEISRRRVAAARAAKAEGRKFNEADIGRSMTVSHRHIERPDNVKRAHTSWGEVSPGLQTRFNRPKSPPPQTQPTDATDDEEETRQFQRPRAATGATIAEDMPNDEPDFRPGPLKRSQTGLSEMTPESPEDDDPPRLPELSKVASSSSDGSSLHFNAELNNYLSSEPTNPDSLAARVQHQMRADEGQALHQASAEPSPEDDRLPSMSSSSTFEVGSPRSMSSTSYRRPSYDQGAKAPPRPNPFDDPTSGRRPSSISSNGHASLTHSNTSPTDTSSQRDFIISPPHSRPPSSGYFQSGLAPPAVPPHAASPNSIDATTPTQRDFDSRDRSPMRSPALNVEIPKQPPRSPNVLADRTAGWSAASSGHRADLAAAGDAALDDFAERVEHMRGVFKLTAEVKKSVDSYAPMTWMRAAIWWFLKGRSGLEVMIRNRPRGQTQEQQLLTQAHVDLAKTWWILTEVLDNHPGIRKFGKLGAQADKARAAGDEEMTEFFEIQESTLSSLKGLLISVSRNNVMPPENALIQGQNQDIWVNYPTFTPDVEAVLGGKSKSIVVDTANRPINPRSVMPLSDTKEDFCYGRIFVNVGLSSEDDDDLSGISLPAVLTILRPHNDWNVKIGLCSQTDLLTCAVQGDPKKGLTWANVKWKTGTRGLSIRLPRGFTLNVDLEEKDYRMLWGIFDYTRQVEASMNTRQDEQCIHEVTVRDLQYKDPQNPSAFPPDRIKRCKVRIFEKFVMVNEGTGQRKLHRGYRLLMITSPRSKTLSTVSHEFTGKRPIIFEFRSDPGDANIPLMMLRIREEGKKICTAIMSFNDTRERVQLFQILNGLMVGPDEFCPAQVPLKGYLVEQVGMKEVFSAGHDIVKKMQWQDVKVLNKEPDDPEVEVPQTILSEELRVITRHACGSITDRMNLGPGEMLVRLDNSGNPDIHFLRFPQDDATAAVDAKRADTHVPDAIADFLRTIKTSPTIRSYCFKDHEAMHRFQQAVTGFEVKYDGIAATLAISRRRMVVPIYKRWEAQTVRLQILQQAGTFQFCAYMEDFSHADAMNFQIKSMDLFEKIELKGSKGERGRYGLRMVDAKFWLPPERKRDNGPVDEVEQAKRRFACLDMPEYPGEHDDITLGFETEAERNRFSDALPAATQATKFTLRRKI